MGSFYIVKEGKHISLFDENDKGILCVDMPGALGTNTKKTMTWYMIVTWQEVVLKSCSETVLVRSLCELNDGEKVRLEERTRGWIILHFLILALFAVAATLAIILLGALYFGAFSRNSMPRMFPSGLRPGMGMFMDDIFCRTADKDGPLDCASFPSWLHSQEYDASNYLILQADGNLVLYNTIIRRQPLWSSETQGKDCTRFDYIGKGQFELQCSDKTHLFSQKKKSETHRNPLLCYRDNQDDPACADVPKDWDYDLDGPYDPKRNGPDPYKFMSYVLGEPIDHSSECSDHHELLPGMKLGPNCGRLCDSTGCISMATNGRFTDFSDTGQYIVFQKDGNLVRYSGTGKVTWSSGTKDQGCTRVEKRGHELLIKCGNSIKTISLF